MPYWDTDSSSSDDGYSYYDNEPRCNACNRDFASDRSLAQHNAAVHSFGCNKCTRTFTSARGREQHTSAVHAHHCDTCGRDFKSANNLAQHAQTHRPKKTPCPGCGQLYRSWTDASLHFETGRCPSCPGRTEARKKMYDLVSASGTGFVSRPLMIGNGGRMEGGYDEDSENYACKVCDRGFKAMGSLLQHCDARPQCWAGNSGLSRLRIGS